MISDLKKFVFIGVKEDLDTFFNRAQEKGVIEFIPEDRASILYTPKYIEDIVNAIKIIKHFPTEDRAFTEDSELQKIIDEILLLQKKIDTMQEERLHIQSEIEKMRPLGQFSLDDIHQIEKLSSKRVAFFSCKRGHRERDQFPDDLIYVTSDHDLDYFIYVGSEYPEYTHLNELTFTLSLNEWIEKNQHWERGIKEAYARLKKLAIYIDYLKDNLAKQLNHSNLTKTKESTSDQLDGSLFTINGWVPKKKMHELIDLCHDLSVYFEEVAIEVGEKIPTFMENRHLNAVGEDIVNIYDVPAPQDKDPSMWVLVAFALFFAMIVSDAGYGLIYLLLGIFLRFKVYKKVKDVGKRFIKLVIILGVSSTLWGIMTCSYFSVDVNPANPLSKYSLLTYLSEKKAEYHMRLKDDVYDQWIKEYPQLKSVATSKEFLVQAVKIVKNKHIYEMIREFNDNILLEFSLLVGVIHIALSFMRNLRKCWPGLGWIAFVIGGYLYFPIELEATSMLHFLGVISKTGAEQIGYQLLIGGVIVAMVLSLIQNRLKGITEVLNSIQIFADVLSYLRLYALGLAGMILAATINQIGGEINWAIGALVTILGHSVNIVLGIMSGVIHGLRLNFLEWYHYSFEGGGRLFNPLKLIKTHHS